MNRYALVMLAFVLLLAAPGWAEPRAESLPPELEDVGIYEHLGDTLPLDAVFTDDLGNEVRLGDYFKDGKPVVMSLGYYSCPMLCDLVLNGMIDGLKEIEYRIGEDFKVITVSIDPAEQFELAALKKKNYVISYEDENAAAGWHFLTGEQDNIDQIANSIGFGYKWNSDRQEFMHAAAIYVISPEGKITRYLYGVLFEPRDLKLALLEGSAGRIGDTFDQALLYCYVYDATKGRYGPAAMNIMRLGGGLTAFALVIFLGVLWLREKSRKRGGANAQTAH